MILTVKKHFNYSVFDSIGNRIGHVTKYNTETKEISMYVKTGDNIIHGENNKPQLITFILLGSYAKDDGGND